MEEYLNQNTTAFCQHEPLFKAQQIDELDSQSRTTLDRLRPLLVKRGELGLYVEVPVICASAISSFSKDNR